MANGRPGQPLIELGLGLGLGRETEACREAASQRSPCLSSDDRVAELAGDIVERFAAMTVDDVRGRYAIGRLMLSLASEEGSVAQLARMVGCSTKALYQYSVVTKRFNEGELNYWLARRNTDGQPPSWSHFVLLCSVASRSNRTAILEKWLERPIGIRELAAQLRLQKDSAEQSELP